jgi:hypothetical protein
MRMVEAIILTPSNGCQRELMTPELLHAKMITR